MWETLVWHHVTSPQMHRPGNPLLCLSTSLLRQAPARCACACACACVYACACVFMVANVSVIFALMFQSFLPEYGLYDPCI